jgi:hypothetical protein
MTKLLESDIEQMLIDNDIDFSVANYTSLNFILYFCHG